MRVGPFAPQHVAPLYDIYRRLTAGVPHCRFAPSRAYVAAALATPSPAGMELLVARDGAHVRGFAALLPVPPRRAAPDDPPPGQRSKAEITACFASDETVEEALVAACLGRAREVGAAEVVAFPQEHGRCPIRAYNADWCGLSDRLPSLARALARAGFAPCYRELHLACEGGHFPPAATAPPPGVAVVAGEPQGEQREVGLRAMDGDEQAGVCVWSTLAHVTDDPAARRWGYVQWLHVAQAWRRRGLARHLLTRALGDMAAQGCAGCWLTTGADNWPAQPLYLSLGFEIVDASACFSNAPAAAAAPP